MEKIEEIKVDYKMYKELCSMLKGSEEDFEIACSNIANIKLSNIMITLLSKNLSYGKRSRFMDKFTKEICAVFKTEENKLNLKWDEIYNHITVDPDLTDLEKNIMTKEIEDMVLETLKSLEYTFIKTIKIELK